MKGTIQSICISSSKGTKKKEIDSAEILPDWGIKNDAHAGNWHRQVSFLSIQSIEKMKMKGFAAHPGDFAENITVDGIDFSEIAIGDTLIINDTIILEVTQIGKECHSSCEIRIITGDCIMPREGIFARVLRGGTICIGNEVLIRKKEQLIDSRIIIGNN